MDFKHFWENYIQQSAADVLPQAMEVFAQPIGQAIKDEYDLIEVVLEVSGGGVHAKQFEQVTAFLDLLRQQQPDLYCDTLPFMCLGLIEYFLFSEQEAWARTVLRDMAQHDPEGKYDELLLSLKKTLYYGYDTEVNHISEQIYAQIKQSSRLISGAEEELGIFHIYYTLQQHYERAKGQGQTIDWATVKADLEAYDFNQDVSFVEPVHEGLFPPDEVRLRDQLPTRYRQNEEATLLVIQMCFMREMLSRGMPFALSICLWGHMMAYWQKRQQESKSPDTLSRFFYLEAQSFHQYILSRRGMLLDYRFDAAAALWGSLFVYDFLYRQELIDEHAHQRSSAMIHQEIEAFLTDNQSNFWAYDFVHRWCDRRPRSYTAEAWQAERERFAEDLSAAPPKHEYVPADEQGLDPRILIETLEKLEKESYYKPSTRLRDSFRDLGRNDRINVRYQDGRVVENVKFKKVEADLRAGECELI